jgi:hypothetical protein
MIILVFRLRQPGEEPHIYTYLYKYHLEVKHVIARNRLAQNVQLVKCNTNIYLTLLFNS